MVVERLQKILSNAGVASRRVAEQMIVEGRVAVNGTVERMLGARADLETDEVTLDGVPIDRGRYRYFMLNKPAGFVTTASDDLERETVMELVPIGDIQLHPVGRLDMDSEGLLIITNDGHLTDLLTHPRYEVSKDYLVGLDAPPAKRELERLVRGVESDGEKLRASTAQPARAPEGGIDDVPEAPAWLLVTLKEGKNREVRRMMAVIGRDVLTLRRVRIGPLHLGELSLGAFRELTDDEVQKLYAAAKPNPGYQSARAPKAPAPEGRGRPGPALNRARGGPPPRPRVAPPSRPRVAPPAVGPSGGDASTRARPQRDGVPSATNPRNVVPAGGPPPAPPRSRVAPPPARPDGPPPGGPSRSGPRPAGSGRPRSAPPAFGSAPQAPRSRKGPQQSGPPPATSGRPSRPPTNNRRPGQPPAGPRPPRQSGPRGGQGR